MSDVPLERKIGMINLWRKRCTKLKEFGIDVKAEDCATCDAVTKAIEADIKECHMARGFGGGKIGSPN